LKFFPNEWKLLRFAPYHPRLDHQIYYETFALRGAEILLQNPYHKSCQYTWFERLLQLILRGDKEILKHFNEIPLPQGTSKIRATEIAAQFTSYKEKMNMNGQLLKQLNVGTHHFPMSVIQDQSVWALPEPKKIRSLWWRQFFAIP